MMLGMIFGLLDYLVNPCYNSFYYLAGLRATTLHTTIELLGKSP